MQLKNFDQRFNKIILFLFGFILCGALNRPLSAHQLIMVSSDSICGPGAQEASCRTSIPASNGFWEKVSFELVKFVLKDKYSQMHFWSGGAKGNTQSIKKDWLANIVAGLKENEKIDVFSLQHGADQSFFAQLPASDVEQVFAPGVIRNVYSSACYQWGEVYFKNDLSNLISLPNFGFNTHLDRLRVTSYSFHTNYNATGTFTFPLMLAALRFTDSWPLATLYTHREFHYELSQLFPFVLGLENNKLLNASFPAISYFKDIRTFLLSLPVIGIPSTELDSLTSKMSLDEVFLRTQRQFAPNLSSIKAPSAGLEENKPLSYVSFLLKPLSSLRQQVTLFCGGDGDYWSNLHNCKVPLPYFTSPSLFIQKLSETFFRFSQILVGTKKPCLPTSPINLMMGLFLEDDKGQTPELSKLCVSYDHQTNLKFDWEMQNNRLSLLHLRKFKTQKLKDKYLSALSVWPLEYVTFASAGSVSLVSILGKHIRLNFDGVQIGLKFENKTLPTWLRSKGSDGFTHLPPLDPAYFQIGDDLSLEGGYKGLAAGIKIKSGSFFVRFLGQKIKLVN